MQDKLVQIFGILLGVCLIIFRKKLFRLLIKKQLEEKPTQKKTEYLNQIKEMKFEGVLQKGLEILAIILGSFLVIFNTIKLFFPALDRYALYLLRIFAISPFAAGLAILVEYILIFRFLWRKVHKYTQAQYPDWYSSVQNSSGSDKVNAVGAGPTDDPALLMLQKRAGINTLVIFVALFIIFIAVIYTVIEATNP